MSDKLEPQLVRRIDRNTVIGDKAAILQIALSDKNKSHKLYRVGGYAIGTVRGEGKFGDWIKLVGRFRADRFTDGQQFISGSAFLPGDIAAIVEKRLSRVNSETGEVTDQVTFLFDVYVRYDASLATSYGFIVEPVREATAVDPLEQLFNAASAPALEHYEKPALAGPDPGPAPAKRKG